MSNFFYTADGQMKESDSQELLETMGNSNEHGYSSVETLEEEEGTGIETMENDDNEPPYTYESMTNDDDAETPYAYKNNGPPYTYESMENDDESDGRIIENMSDSDNFDLKGNLTLDGNVVTKKALHIDHNIDHPDKGDGTIYRADGQLQIATDDLIRLRHVGSKQTGIQFDTRQGTGDIQNPNGEMKISRTGIMLGGNNNGKEVNSAQISAGIHIPNSLNIVGMSSGKGHQDRRVDMWAEGGFNVHGKPNFNARTDINSADNHIGLNVQSNVDSHIQLKTKNDDNKNVYLINRDGHFRVHHHGVGDMFGVNKDGHTYINSGKNHLGLNVQSDVDSHILLRTKNDAGKDLYLINRDGHFRLHQGGVGDMFGVNKDGHHYVRHTGDHVINVDGDGNNPYISLGKTGTWGGKKVYMQNVDAHTDEPIFRVGVHDKGPMMDMSLKHGARWRRKDGRWTHFDWVDNKNYIRGNTTHDGELDMNGPIRARDAIHIDHNIGHPDNGDGTIYRADGQLQIATDDLIRLRHVGSKQTGIQFDTRPGNGDIHGPNGEMKITRAGIMLGGNNNGKEHNSAQISAGIHVPNSLNIVGMSSGKGHQDRRVDMWAEGVFNVHGGVAAHQGAQNGWISGNFGAHSKDRVVLGNLENQATVGSHNNELNAWRQLTLRGDQINLTSHNGRINFNNGWNVRTGDGHFRLYHGDDQQFVVHNPHAGPEWSNVTWAPRLRSEVETRSSGDVNVHGNVNFKHPNGQQWVAGMRDPNHFAINKFDASGKNKGDGTGFLIRHDGHVWTGGGGFHHGSHDQGWYNHWQHNIHMGRR
jgi:hypothetical protein